ncbi:similar to Saccharomyces cerevisiae YIL049W DFG10 Probable polyprenol reductase that catalyzes conversion of polyprenol to dolichol, the precursor for N-glycosylation [Maudiozyma saulgeensis]|uniref:Polyprenal reductase n=1 Tax=Maudiozyma saulgeensis TaxID=1789683 RepID=A0A1X7QYS2_9SACH|nr:similar to Saccharomyces cerevisiae YIL049W DFG10 Probable polyprenol reductase that catalyzes conversion of polyprenol to dolichol, the precursor for N-glycosylation [Kazachstania saulgeensis]
MAISIIDQYIPYITFIYRLSFLIGLLSLLLAKFILPDFLQYGKTLSFQKTSSKKHREEKSRLDIIIHYTVPKAYFSHFYILSTFLSLITCVSYANYALPWLILFHSLRRLYETLYVSKYTSKSRMNWSHYIVGIWFYSVLHIILNIKLKKGEIPNDLHKWSATLFIISSWDQYMNHKVLSRLVKYSLPKARLFKLTSSPHYLDELLIYGSLISYNTEFLWLTVWIFTSLSISAVETQKYYKIKFPKEQIAPYAYIPFLI